MTETKKKTTLVDDVKTFEKEMSQSMYNVGSILTKKGYKIHKKIADTLQGRVYIGEIMKTNKKVAIKITSIDLHINRVTNINTSGLIKVHENIETEIKITLHLQKKSPPKGFVKCIDYFKDKKYIYLIMEYGGKPLFDYIKRETNKLHNGKLSSLYWKNHIKKLFKQMVYFVKWLHDNKCCHLDISLENFLIDDTNNTIKFCDFGLAQYFKDYDFRCKKYCGKSNYQCPEVYYKHGSFDARKADIWSLGVVLCMMLIGASIYGKPTLSDPYFYNIYNGYLKMMIQSWEIDEAMTENVYDLLNGIFKPEKKRFSIIDIINHKYLQDI